MTVRVDSAVAPDAKADAGANAEIRRAAQSFEALFVTMLVQRMRESQLDEGMFGSSAGSAIYEGMFDQHLADSITEGRPLGIAEMLERHWIRENVVPGEATRAAREASGAYEESRLQEVAGQPAVAPDPGALPETPAAAQRPAGVQKVASIPGISRSYGWGTDPIDGSHRFHGGVDLPAPTGTPVLSVAPGRVVEVKDHPGYGLRVIVEHGKEWSSRYSHLSRAEVRPGDWIGRGQQIGSVGDSGRSTGPHLHFETLNKDRKVDPAEAAPGPIRTQVLGFRADESR